MAIPTICEFNLVASGPELNLNEIGPGTREGTHLSEFPQSVDDLMFSAIDDASQTEP